MPRKSAAALCTLCTPTVCTYCTTFYISLLYCLTVPSSSSNVSFLPTWDDIKSISYPVPSDLTATLIDRQSNPTRIPYPPHSFQARTSSNKLTKKVLKEEKLILAHIYRICTAAHTKRTQAARVLCAGSAGNTDEAPHLTSSVHTYG